MVALDSLFAPERQHVFAGEIGEDVKAALLRFDQVQPLHALCVAAAAQRQRGGAEGPFLPRELLALHEVEHRDQQARDLGVGGAVGGLEHHGQQARDELGKGGGRLRRVEFERGHAAAQRGQGVQARQHPGDAAEQARAVAGAGALAGFGLELVEAAAHLLFERQAFGDLRIALLGEAAAARGEEHVGHAAFALQRMHQPADHADQLAGAGELVQLVDFALAGGNEEMQAGFHGGWQEEKRAPQRRCNIRASARACPFAGTPGRRHLHSRHALVGNRIILR
jgi:hypothetical protein